MFPKIEWKPIINSLFGAAFGLISLLLIQNLIAKREYKNNIQDQINKRPTIETVNKQVADVKSELQKDDAELRLLMEQHIEASREADFRTIELIKSIDSKVNVLINR